MSEIYIGIDVGGTNIKIMLMDSKKTILDSSSIPTLRDEGYERITDRIVSSIRKKISDLPYDNKKVVAICMGLPGTIDVQNQKTIHLAYLGWNHFNPSEKIGKIFDCPTFIDNDGSLNVWGEYCYSDLTPVDSVVLLTLGTGIGCGIIHQGKIFRGASSIGAELGHMTIDSSSDAMCLCGKKGHFESFCSGSSLIRYTLDQRQCHPESILNQFVLKERQDFRLEFLDEACVKGDMLAISIFERFHRYLSVGLANVMKLFNPDLILLGGGVSLAKSIQIQWLEKLVLAELLTPEQFCPIRKAILGGNAGVYGACLKAFELQRHS